MLLWPESVHGNLTPDFSRYCNVLQVSAGGKKRKRKRVLKSKMFVDEEEGCMGKTVPHTSVGLIFIVVVLKVFAGQPLPGRGRGSQYHFILLLPHAPSLNNSPFWWRPGRGLWNCGWILNLFDYSQVFLPVLLLSLLPVWAPPSFALLSKDKSFSKWCREKSKFWDKFYLG